MPLFAPLRWHLLRARAAIRDAGGRVLWAVGFGAAEAILEHVRLDARHRAADLVRTIKADLEVKIASGEQVTMSMVYRRLDKAAAAIESLDVES